MNFITGTFTKDSSGTAGAMDTISPGFTPAAVIFFYTKEGANDSTDAELVAGWGFSDGTDDYAVCIASQDAQASSVCDRRHAAKGITMIDVGGALIAEASITFSGSDVVVTWDTNDANAWLISYAIFGGVRAKVGTFTSPGATGTATRTGIGFHPTIGFFATAGDGTATPNSAVDAICCFGFADSFTTDAVIRTSADDAVATTDTKSALGTSGSIAVYALKGGVWSTDEGTITAWNSDGWAESWTILAVGGWIYGYLVMDGILAKIDATTAPTSVGTQARTGYGFQPEGVIAATQSHTTSAVDNVRAGIGAASSTSDRAAIAWADLDAAADSDTGMRRSAGHVIIMLNNTGTIVVDGTADLSSFDADGLTWNWDDAPAAANQWRCIAFTDRKSLALPRPSVAHYIGR